MRTSVAWKRSVRKHVPERRIGPVPLHPTNQTTFSPTCLVHRIGRAREQWLRPLHLRVVLVSQAWTFRSCFLSTRTRHQTQASFVCDALLPLRNHVRPSAVVHEPRSQARPACK